VFFVNIPIGLVAIAYGIRLLHESRDETQERPDLVGSALIVGAIGVLALGLVKGPEWGWADTRTIGALAAAAAGLAAFWARCLTHRSPVIDPALLRVRSFALSNLASVLFSAAFAAFLLANVLFMTSVWHESVIRAGLSLAPGPVMASLVAVTSGRFLNRFGQRAFAALGIALFTLGCLWWRLRVGETPAYASEMLPGLLLGGTGVGFVLPSLASASAASVPRERFATGSAIYTMTRQVGYVPRRVDLRGRARDSQPRRPGCRVRPRLGLHDHRREPRDRDRTLHREGRGSCGSAPGSARERPPILVSSSRRSLTGVFVRCFTDR